MKKVALAGLLLLAGACNNSEPAATGYKSQLSGAPAAAAGDQNPTPTPTGGDATKGKAFLASNCESCHKLDGAAHALDEFDIPAIEAIKTAPIGAHGAASPLNTSIEKNIPDLKAALGGGTAAPAAATGDATKGQAALTASCNVCHTTGGAGHVLTKADATKIAGAGSVAAHSQAVKDVLTASAADISAFLNK